MPIYEYECTSCHHQFDTLQKVNEPAHTLCPNCSKHKLVKLVSAAGFQLKGTGWYATDFKNNPSSAVTEKKANTTASSESATKETRTTTTSTNGDAK